MNHPASAVIPTEVLAHLTEHCMHCGLFAKGVRVDPEADLIESGQVDSMGLTALQSIIEEVYGVVIPEAVYVAELRSLSRIAAYLAGELVRMGEAAHTGKEP